MKCVGLLGELAGYSAGFTWQFPVVQVEAGLAVPALSRWTHDDLEPMCEDRRETMATIEPVIDISEGDVVLVRGVVYAEHQSRAGVASGIEWQSFTGDFELAIAPIDIFIAEEQRVRDLASTAYWRALVEKDHDRCRSSLRLLQVNGQLDRVTTLFLRAIMHARFPDPVAMDHVVEIARARAGLDPSDVVDAARELLDSLGQMTSTAEVEDLQRNLARAIARSSPIIPLHEIPQQRQVGELVDVVLHEVEKAEKQGYPVKLLARQVRRGLQVSPVALALLAHLLRHDPENRLVLDTTDSAARNVLERTGVLDLTDRGALRAQLELAVGHVVLRDNSTAFHVTEFHRSPERTYRQQLVDNDIPRWLRNACDTTSQRHRDSISRAIGRLLDNVRGHADLTRDETSRSGLYLSVTQGGGDESINRLSVVVFDNGAGLRTALENECGPLHSSTPDLVRWLFTGEPVMDSDRSSLEEIGTGFRELVAALRQITEYSRSSGDAPARSHINVISSSRVDGRTDLVVADILADPPWIESFPSPSGTTGTTILLSIPLANRDAELGASSASSASKRQSLSAAVQLVDDPAI